MTGGAGFIGSALVRHLLLEAEVSVVTLDKLTYAGHLASLGELMDHPRHRFVQGDITDAGLVAAVFRDHAPARVMHLAAETHVDRSIAGPAEFIATNVVGTYVMLEAAAAHFQRLDPAGRKRFRFLHVSTDEVFGSLEDGEYFSELSQYQPSSPYSASKASSDHLARAWQHTYGLPVLISNCTNNYGPRQFPEKLIPLMIANAMEYKPLPVYGDGLQVRDWLYVEDHARALHRIVERGRPGEIYCVGGEAEKTNLEVVNTLCSVIDARLPGPTPRHRLITHVADRPGHDRRYAMDIGKIRAELGWSPAEDFRTGLAKTVDWYLDNPEWARTVVADAAARLPSGMQIRRDGTQFMRKQEQ